MTEQVSRTRAQRRMRRRSIIVASELPLTEQNMADAAILAGRPVIGGLCVCKELEGRASEILHSPDCLFAGAQLTVDEGLTTGQWAVVL